MRKSIAVLCAGALLIGLAAPVAAGVPPRNCGNENSGWNKVDAQGWWDASVEGFAIAGVTVYVGGDPNNGFTSAFNALAADFGFADGQAFYEFIVGPQFEDLDANGDGFVCMKALPINKINPGYFFAPKDNSSNAGAA